MKPSINTSWNSLPGPEDITRLELSNGITLLTRANFNSPSVVMSGYLTSGSQFDPDEKLGLAYFTSSALMRGTQSHAHQEIFEILEFGWGQPGPERQRSHHQFRQPGADRRFASTAAALE